MNSVTDLRPIRDSVFVESTIPTLVVDRAARVIDLNDAYIEMTRRPREALIGHSTIEFISAEDVPAVISGLDRLLGGARAVRHKRRHLRGDDTWLAIETVTSLIADPAGGDDLVLVQTIGQGSEVTLIDPDDELLNRQQFSPAGDASCIHDREGRVVFSSDGLDTLLGRPAGWIIGRTLIDSELDPIHSDGSRFVADDYPVPRAIAENRELTATIGVLNSEGNRIWISMVVGPVKRSELPARSSLRNITDLVEAQNEARRLAALVEERLTYQADHDELTGIASRRAVLRRVDESIDAAASASVVFVDLDGFKAVNDTLGHVIGDNVLVDIAGLLDEIAGPTVVVGRAGGDEFIAVTASPEDAEAYATEVRARASSADGLVPDVGIRVGASVGTAHSRTGDTSTSLLARADRMMYEAKRAKQLERAGRSEPGDRVGVEPQELP